MLLHVLLRSRPANRLGNGIANFLPRWLTLRCSSAERHHATCPRGLTTVTMGVQGADVPILGSRSRPIASPRPSASVILLSPTNEVLLLHRVQQATSFPSAHVFPGGNVSPQQDGSLPDREDALRFHADTPVYRLTAIRECFEESGYLLARPKSSAGNAGGGAGEGAGSGEKIQLLALADDVISTARKAVHNNEIRFMDWLEEVGGIPNIENLVPFTRWVTPEHMPRRYSTQMYLYFLPLGASEACCSRTQAFLGPPSSMTLSSPSSSWSSSSSTEGKGYTLPTPTTDGGIEHTAARFLHPSTWLLLAQSGSITLFPPQYLLLHLLAIVLNLRGLPPSVSASPSLSPSPSFSLSHPTSKTQQQRDAVLDFVRSGDPPWTQKYFSPSEAPTKMPDGRSILLLDRPIPELARLGRRGDPSRCILIRFTKQGPRDLDVCWRDDVERLIGGSSKL